jgi:hypothetical protein
VGCFPTLRWERYCFAPHLLVPGTLLSLLILQKPEPRTVWAYFSEW